MLNIQRSITSNILQEEYSILTRLKIVLKFLIDLHVKLWNVFSNLVAFRIIFWTLLRVMIADQGWPPEVSSTWTRILSFILGLVQSELMWVQSNPVSCQSDFLNFFDSDKFHMKSLSVKIWDYFPL